MSEAETNTQGQKPKTSKLALTSAILAAPVILMSIVTLFVVGILIDMPGFASVLLLALTLVSIFLASLSLYWIKKHKSKVKGKILAVVVLIGVALSFALLLWHSAKIRYHRLYTLCQILNLHTLKLSLDTYSYDNEGRYPTAEKWCDLLKDYHVEHKFVCPAKRMTGERCSYAINPNCEPNSTPDMVLLFETKGGWNQFGGPELLSTKNHPYVRDWFWGYRVTGCNILFNDGHSEFVPKKRFHELKWKAEDAHQGDKTHLAATTATLKKLHSAVCGFYMDTGRYPTDEEGLMALIKKPSDASNYKPGGYLEYKEIPKDAWGNEFVYKRSPESGKGFVIISPGLGNEEKGDGGCPEELYSTHP
jgi:type II secretion system protein G